LHHGVKRAHRRIKSPFVLHLGVKRTQRRIKRPFAASSMLFPSDRLAEP